MGWETLFKLQEVIHFLKCEIIFKSPKKYRLDCPLSTPSSQPKPFLPQPKYTARLSSAYVQKMSKFFRRTAVSASRRVRTAMATRPSPSTSRLSSSSSPSPVQATSSQRTTFLKQQRTQLLVSSSSAAHRNFRSRLYSINSYSPSPCLSLLFPCCFFFYFCFFFLSLSSFFSTQVRTGVRALPLVDLSALHATAEPIILDEEDGTYVPLHGSFLLCFFSFVPPRLTLLLFPSSFSDS